MKRCGDVTWRWGRALYRKHLRARFTPPHYQCIIIHQLFMFIYLPIHPPIDQFPRKVFPRFPQCNYTNYFKPYGKYFHHHINCIRYPYNANANNVNDTTSITNSVLGWFQLSLLSMYICIRYWHIHIKAFSESLS